MDLIYLLSKKRLISIKGFASEFLFPDIVLCIETSTIDTFSIYTKHERF